MKDIIDMTMGELRTEIDNGIMRAVQNVGVNVNKEELIKALELNEKLVRCYECVYCNVQNTKYLYAICERHGIEFKPFEDDTRTHGCTWGERKETDHE